MKPQPTNPPPVPTAGNEKQLRKAPARSGILPPFRVILLDNPAQDLMYIVRTVMELTRLCRIEATHKMWEAHHTGRSQLLVTHKERAELYIDQFWGKGIKVDVEPA